jgi:CRP-like cAMP-binding protein
VSTAEAPTLANCPSLADKIRLACENLPNPTTNEVRQWLRANGVETRRPYASQIVNTWRREKGLSGTGDLPQLTPELLEELDALRAAADRPTHDHDTADRATDRADEPADERVDEPESLTAEAVSDRAAVAELRTELDEARALVDLQGDPALRLALSREERAEERRVIEEVRAKEREQRKRSALAQVARENREQKVADEIASMEQDDRLWQRRAQSQRRRLVDPSARMADLFRWHSITTRGLLLIAAIGIGWTAVNVQRAIVPASVPADDVVYWLGFAVEPLISAPLLVLMVLQSVAGRWGKRFGGDKAPYVYLAEALLLLLSIALNSAPYLQATFVNGQTFATTLGHFVPPIMIAFAIFLQPIAASFFGRLLVEAGEKLDAEVQGR